MVDINAIRQNAQGYKKAVTDKGIDLNIDLLLKTDGERRKLLLEVENLRRQRNEAAKERNIEKGREVKARLDHLEEDLAKVEVELKGLMVKVPTIPSPDTPIGQSDEDNVEVRRVGEIRKFSFTPKDHIQLGRELDILDLEAGAKVSGYRGYYLKNEGALLVMALMNYALKKLVEKGFTPILPPTMVKGFALFGTGYFKGLTYNPETDEIYQVASPDKEVTGEIVREQKFLVGTAEPSLLAYFAKETLKEEELPKRIVGFSQCYRSEIGSYGKETKGLYRVHEFMKVEQVVLAAANIEEADKLQEEMLSISEEILKELNLPYRVIQICTGDLSTGKYRQYDLEVWMPGLNRFGEVGSASNFLDWQARRLDTKYVDSKGNKKYVFMLNNTVLPSPRPLIAILENFQQEDGSVIIPEVLRPYTGFSEIKPKKRAA